MAQDEPGREIIIEMQRFDGYVRVCAVDVETGLEVVAIGDAKVSELELKRLGSAKLMRQLRLEGKLGPDGKTPPATGRGRLV
jgi:hypothetical protein